MFNRTNYPSVPTPPDVVRELRAGGMSQTRIARHLHISPTKFKERVADSNELQRALDAGATAYEADKTNRPPRKPNANLDDNEYKTTLPLQPLDDIIFNAIAAGTCDRPAIEKILNPQRSKHIQIIPSLERLLQHNKIKQVSAANGVILTKYEIIEDQTAAA